MLVLLARWLRRLAAWLEGLLPAATVSGQITFTTSEGVVQVGQITVPADTASLQARVSFRDSEGSETPAQDVPAWTSSDEGAVTLEVSEDGLTATATIGVAGASLIEVRSFTDDGDEIVAQGTVTVTPGEPATGEVSFSAPAEEPPVEEPPAEEVLA